MFDFTTEDYENALDIVDKLVLAGKPNEARQWIYEHVMPLYAVEYTNLLELVELGEYKI
jgi:hypothetical protein|nr:MAG TPA_asm: hypothetical protein [Caudoviricetes sp.]